MIKRVKFQKAIKDFSSFLVHSVNQFKFHEHSFVIFVAIFIGLIGGLGAVLIHHSIHWFQELFWQGKFNLQTISQLPWYWKILVPTMGGIVVGLIIRYVASEAKGHGVPEVMSAIALRNGIIRPRVVLAKLFASALYIASGGSVGREGPVIQIGSAVGSTIGQMFRVNPRRMRTFVACGAASGIAAAFNAPVAGALFAVEIILADFAVASFSPIVISSVVATVVSRSFLGNYPAFLVPSYELISPWELINYAVLGFLAGLVALAFIKVLYFSEDFFDKLTWPDYAKGAVGGIIIGTIGIFFPQIFGVGYDTMTNALYGDLIWQLALALVFLKIAATSISLGSGGSGGIFAPSLFMGAMLGAFFGYMMNYLFPEYSAGPGAYALVAMGGVVGAATHGPIAAILIIFEMTNDYKIILPLMITTIIATVVAQRFHKESIYTLKLIRRGINLHGGREMNVLKALKVTDVTKQVIEVIHEKEPFTAILKKISSSTQNYIYVHNNNGKVTGYISMQEIRQTLLDFDALKHLLIAADVANPNIYTVNEKDNLDFVMKQFGRNDIDEMPVMSDKNGNEEIIGVIRQTDVIEAYNHQIFLRDMSGETVQSLEALKQRKKVQVVDQYQFSEIEASSALIGKTLKNVDLRNAYNVEILLIRRTKKSKTEYIQPSGNTQIKMNDSLLIFGKAKDISMFEKV